MQWERVESLLSRCDPTWDAQGLGLGLGLGFGLAVWGEGEGEGES